jgi:hypothetical protein
MDRDEYLPAIGRSRGKGLVRDRPQPRQTAGARQ